MHCDDGVRNSLEDTGLGSLLSISKRLAEIAEVRAASMNVSVSITVVDIHGNLTIPIEASTAVSKALAESPVGPHHPYRD